MNSRISRDDRKTAPEILVRRFSGGRVVEHRYCTDEAMAAEIVEAWSATADADGEVVSVETHPHNDIIEVLRAVADALERGEPVTMPRPFPYVRLQLVVDGHSHPHSESTSLWQELSHPAA